MMIVKEGISSDDFATYEYKLIRDKQFCLIVPFGYKPSGNVIWHYHGFRSASWDRERDGHFRGEGTIQYKGFNFGKTLFKRAQDTAMVCPIGTLGGSMVTYSLARDYKSVTQINPVLQVVSELLNGGKPFTNVIISGHSGAYKPITPVLRGGTGRLPVKSVFLFDALYDEEQFELTPFRVFGRKGGKIYNASPENSGTRAASESLVGTPNYILKTPKKLSHWDLVGVYFDEFLALEKAGRK